MIDVAHEEAERRLFGARLFDGAIQLQIESFAVWDAGQNVGQRFLAHIVELGFQIAYAL
jgi:hypothetical protein